MRSLVAAAIKLIPASCLLLSVYPAYAESSQTVEGARRFLAILFDAGVDREQLYPGMNSPIRDRITKSLPPIKECKVSFVSVGLKGEISSDGGDGISLDRIVNMSKDGSIVKVNTRFNKGVLSQEFDFLSADLASRAIYALEFLHQRCDPTANTGF